MDEKNPARSRASLLGWLLALYVLSVGPVAGLANRLNAGPDTTDALEIVYAPLVWIYEHGGAVGALLDWYIRLFRP